jgi:seryl-tRNA(Sec) selenium transferase
MPSSAPVAAAAALRRTAASLTPVINATGVLVHTNLGRAPLSAAAGHAVQAAAGCTDVEFDLESGKRSRRGAGLPQPFTAAEARQALQSSRRVVIPLLEWLDREGITRRLPDDRRIMRETPGHPS